MTTQFDAIIVGTGQSGPSLVARLAGAGRGEIIVTGDKALLALKLYRKIRILTLREYPGTP